MPKTCREASAFGSQLVVVYCREEALAAAGDSLSQFMRGLAQIPVRVQEGALVISDNGDLYGTVADVRERERAG